MDFDVTKYELEDTAVLTVRNARGDDVLIGADGINPVTIEMYGPGSPEGVRARHKAERAGQLRTYRALRNDSDPNDAVNAERELVERLLIVTKTLNNWGQSPKELYGNPRLRFITRQAEEFQVKEANFSKGP